jgi:hypothetical protein
MKAAQIGLFCLGIPLLLWGQDLWTVSSRGGRPMLEAVRAANSSFGWVITYEEGPYDATRLIRANTADRELIPRALPMSFHVETAKLNNAPSLAVTDRLQVIRDLTLQYNKSQTSGTYYATQDGNFIHVRPALWAVNGKAAEYKSPLDNPVSLEPASSYPNLASAINTVAEQAAAASKVSLVVGTMPYNIFLVRKMKFDVPAGLPARKALIELLAQASASSLAIFSPDQFTWELVYDGNSKGYFLNFYTVPNKTKPTPHVSVADALSKLPDPPSNSGSKGTKPTTHSMR